MCSHCQPGEPCAGEGDQLRLYLLRGAAAQRIFSGQHLENFEVPLAILHFGLNRFFFPSRVCVCVKFLLPKQLKHTHSLPSVLQSLLGGGGGGGVRRGGGGSGRR